MLLKGQDNWGKFELENNGDEYIFNMYTHTPSGTPEYDHVKLTGKLEDVLASAIADYGLAYFTFVYSALSPEQTLKVLNAMKSELVKRDYA